MNYISQYYANEDEPPVDYPMDSDEDDRDDDRPKRLSSILYQRGLHTNHTHNQIMKNVNKSLIDRNYLPDSNRLKQLDQHVRVYMRSIENQTLQRELNHDLIRCFSSAYIHDLRREDNRHLQARNHPRSFTYEDIQDIHMPSVLEAYRMKTAVDREQRVRLNHSFDARVTSSTPTSSIAAGQMSPLISLSSPLMARSFIDNADAHAARSEVDRQLQRSQTSVR
jgi:hypothetical protein